jgi:hypothetical protein
MTNRWITVVIAAALLPSLSAASAGAGPPPIRAVPSALTLVVAQAGDLGTEAPDALTLTQIGQLLTQINQTLTRIQKTVGSILTGGFRLPSAPGQNLIAGWLGQIQQWLSTALNWAGSAAWTEWGSEWGQAPDYNYSIGTIAAELSELARTLPGTAQQWLQALTQSLRQAPAPQAGTPQNSSTQIASTNAVFGARAHSVQQSQVAATAAQAVAQAAAEQVREVAQQATEDTTPQDMADAAAQIAQLTASAVQSAPSTRAAIEVMAAAITQQMAQQIAGQAAIASRLDALLTQQAALATEISQAVAGLATTSGLLAQQLTQELEDQAQSAYQRQDVVTGGFGGLASEMRFLAQGGDPQGLSQFLSGFDKFNAQP